MRKTGRRCPATMRFITTFTSSGSGQFQVGGATPGTTIVRPDDIPLVHAVVVECKLAQQNPVHLARAKAQVQEGLRHLTGLLAPKHGDLRRLGFDRRYWWAQLHRAITSRSVINLPEQELKALDKALESLAEGQFEIRWQAVIFTFWTNEAGALPVITPLPLHAGTIDPPFQVPEGFAIRHLALGHQGAVRAVRRGAPKAAASGRWAGDASATGIGSRGSADSR